jgi:hypothetical protein
MAQRSAPTSFESANEKAPSDLKIPREHFRLFRSNIIKIYAITSCLFPLGYLTSGGEKVFLVLHTEKGLISLVESSTILNTTIFEGAFAFLLQLSGLCGAGEGEEELEYV